MVALSETCIFESHGCFHARSVGPQRTGPDKVCLMREIVAGPVPSFLAGTIKRNDAPELHLRSSMFNSAAYSDLSLVQYVCCC